LLDMYQPSDPETFNQIVWEIARQIPEGQVSTYGQIASMIPPQEGTDPLQHERLSARWVGSAMRATPSGSGVPWHRVINSQGMISLPRGSASHDAQRGLLEREGIVFNEKGMLDFNMYGWDGPDKDWLQEHDLQPPRMLKKKSSDTDSQQLSLL
jgi:methylated-DNA-protein-cysteine methyltransferase-like protein